jgi:hypothetical protein
MKGGRQPKRFEGGETEAAGISRNAIRDGREDADGADLERAWAQLGRCLVALLLDSDDVQRRAEVQGLLYDVGAWPSALP